MIADDFKIDPTNKTISYNTNGSKKVYTINQFYSFLQDTFDEPGYMTYEIPIRAKSKRKYFLINGWSIDKEGIKHLKEGTLT